MSDRSYKAPAEGDARRSAPAALRNREPIAEVLAEWLPERGLVLEIASGSGEPALFVAERFPALEWQPTDPDPGALESIAAWRDGALMPNLREPVRLDAGASGWPVERADAVLCINMAHISPWQASLGLLGGAARLRPDGGPLILYGPWLWDEVTTAPSNLEFDGDLKRRDPRWGLRRIEDFAVAARPMHIELEQVRAMPANNFMLLLRRRTAAR